MTPALALDDIDCTFTGEDASLRYTAVRGATLLSPREFVSVVGPRAAASRRCQRRRRAAAPGGSVAGVGSPRPGINCAGRLHVPGRGA